MGDFGEYRAKTIETYYMTSNDYHIDRGGLVPASDLEVYFRKGEKGVYYPDDGWFITDDGREFNPPPEAVKKLR